MAGMICPKCGYSLDAFDKACPRCHVDRAQPSTPMPGASKPRVPASLFSHLWAAAFYGAALGLLGGILAGGALGHGVTSQMPTAIGVGMIVMPILTVLGTLLLHRLGGKPPQ